MTNRQQSAFFLAIVFLFTCGAGLLIYKQYDEYFSQKAAIDLEAADAAQPIVKKSQSPAATSTPDQVNGWKIYKNDQYGFEFSYHTQSYAPENLEAFKSTPNDDSHILVSLYDIKGKQTVEKCQCGEFERFQVLVFNNTNNLSLDNYVKKYLASFYKQNLYSQITVDGERAFEFGEMSREIIVKHGNNIFEIIPIDNILQTFKFTP